MQNNEKSLQNLSSVTPLCSLIWNDGIVFRRHFIIKAFLSEINKTRRSRWCVDNHPGLMLKWQKKLNFVAAILYFWRAFLYQFWPNLVHTYKIHFWISFVLWVVFKCQYFWSYSRKTHFWPFIYIFQRAVTHSQIVRLTRFFSTGSGHSN